MGRGPGTHFSTASVGNSYLMLKVEAGMLEKGLAWIYCCTDSKLPSIVTHTHTQTPLFYVPKNSVKDY